MKKFFCIVAALTALMVSSSCEKDNINKSDFIGIWFLTGLTDNGHDIMADADAITIKVNAGGTMTVYAEGEDPAPGSWKISGKKLTMDGDWEDSAATITKLNSKTLVFKMSAMGEKIVSTWHNVENVILGEWKVYEYDEVPKENWSVSITEDRILYNTATTGSSTYDGFVFDDGYPVINSVGDEKYKIIELSTKAMRWESENGNDIKFKR